MNNRDLELLSASLDGQLDPNESARLESRIASDRELESALADLRAARNVLRKLPQRKAPRNFTLTRKMVGMNPPLPRAYPFFKFSSAFAGVLLMLTFAANLLAPRLSYVGPSNAGWGGGSGGGYGGYGGGAPQQTAPEAAAATEAPAEAPAMEAAPPATMAADFATEAPPAAAPVEKAAGKAEPAPPTPSEVKRAAPVSIQWQIGLFVAGLIGAAVMFVMRRSAKQKWR